MRTRTDSTLPFQDKLEQLDQFNHALIYGFDTEASHRVEMGSTDVRDTLYHQAGQYEDMLDGYLFAQNEFLPDIRNMGEDFDETAFLNHIKSLHGYLANTLLANLHQAKSGEYTQQQVLRWNPNTSTEWFTYCTLLKLNPPSLQGQNPKVLLTQLLTTELGLTRKEVRNYLTLLERLKEDHTIEPRASQAKYLRPEVGSIALMSERLAVAYLTNRLTEEEKALISKIVTICRDPADFPELMENFARTTLTRWKSCDKQDKRAVAEFLAEMFYQFTDIHAFANANGRTATCLINIFLRSINLPSILMRYPGEKSESSSSYSLAIQAINQTREPLVAHIHSRILAAESSPFENTKLKQTIILRCKLANQYKALESNYSTFDVNQYHSSLCQQLERQLSQLPQQGYSSEDLSIYLLEETLRSLTVEESCLDQPKLSQNQSLITKTTLTMEQQIQIKEALHTLTKNQGWKINRQNHLESWVEIPDRTKADEIAKLLREMEIGEVARLKNAKTSVPVVKCSNINFTKLMKLAAALKPKHEGPKPAVSSLAS